MNKEIQDFTPGEALTVEQADHITIWWPRLLTSPLEDQEERDEVAAALPALFEPAEPAWMMARVAALLTPYYTGDVPQGVRMMEAEDWAEALAEYPAWAITKAVRWWKGAENEKRRQKPLEGDIAARARFEMGAVIVAEKAVKRFDRGESNYTPPPSSGKPLDRSHADEILRAAGFKPKRMEAAE